MRLTALALILLASGGAVAEEPNPGPRPVSQLAKELSSTELKVRQGAAWELWKLGDGAVPAVEPLARAVVDEDDYVRKTALAILSRLGEKARPAIPVLEAEMEGRDPAETRRLAWLTARIDPVGSFRSDRAAVRRAAAEAQMHPGEKSAPIVRALLALLRDESAELRAGAANALGMPGTTGTGELHGVVAEALLSRLSDDADAEVRRQAAGALGWIERGAPVEGLVAALAAAATEDEEVAVRQAAILALKASGDTARSTVPLILKALGDPAPEIRGAAALAVGTLAEPEEEVIEALADALEDWDAGARSCAAMALAGFRAGAAPAAKALIACFESHADRRTRTYVVQALAEIGEPAREALPELVAAYQAEEEPPVELAYALVRFRAECAEAALDRLVAVALTDAPGRAQYFLRSLGPLAKAALPALEEGWKKAPEVQKPGIEATILAIRGE